MSEAEWKTRLRRHVGDSVMTKETLLREAEADILAAGRLLVGCLAKGGKILLCGNGGSAADCQHIAAELVSSLDAGKRRPALPALALTTDSSLLTAYSNDFGFDGVFARQLEALGQKGDLLIAISTSGKSVNVIKACETARRKGMVILALTGRSGGDLAGHADVCIKVPSTNTQHIQESHIMIGHILCDFAETIS
jgi:D-sedoheptulose 7-phosphate isomerase